MTVLGTCTTPKDYILSRHIRLDRQERVAEIQKIGLGKVQRSFLVNSAHPQGDEIHNITSTGVIIIEGAKPPHVIVTMYIAEPCQIARYYEETHLPVPYKIVRIAKEHMLQARRRSELLQS